MQDKVAGPDGSALSEGLGAWLPIATAPRDGQWFVAARFDPPYAPEYEIGAYDPLIQTQYEPAGEGLFRKVESIAYEWAGFNNFQRMTHWMPLPAGPQVSA